MKGLAEKAQVARTQLFPIARERARLWGERGEIHASIARARTRMSEIQLQIMAIEENARTEAQRELSVVEAVCLSFMTGVSPSRTGWREPTSGRRSQERSTN